MIKIKYECDETGQEMDIAIAGVGTDKAEMTITFTPKVSDDTEDPFGMIGRLFSAIKPKE